MRYERIMAFLPLHSKSHDRNLTIGTTLPAATIDLDGCQALLLVRETVWIGQLVRRAGRAD